MRDPILLTAKEWDELAGNPTIAEGFGLESSPDPVAELKEMCYACKFDFYPGSPGYVGEVFLVLGDSMEVVVFTRDNSGKLSLLGS